jgi:hypothetical protein
MSNRVLITWQYVRVSASLTSMSGGAAAVYIPLPELSALYIL